MVANRLASVLGVVAGVAACACQAEDADVPAPLALEEDAHGVRGWFQDDVLGAVGFRVEAIRPQIQEIELELRPAGDTGELVLWFRIDRDRGVVEVDAVSPDGNGERALAPVHRALLLALSRALDGLGRLVRPELDTLRDLTSLWSEFPAGMEPRFAIGLRAGHGSASTCGYLGSYVRGTHDGWFEYRGSDRTTLNGVYLSTHAACRSLADEDTQGTRWWIDGAWRCPTSEPDHSTSIEYAYGACFGRCGVGCGSGSVYSWGCLEHDVCNRFGHSWAASVPGGHCSDEFAVAASELLTEPHCFAASALELAEADDDAPAPPPVGAVLPSRPAPPPVALEPRDGALEAMD